MQSKTPAFTRDDVSRLLARADDILSQPPAKPWIDRHHGRGERVLRFVLPLALAAPQNRSRHAEGWMLARQRASVLAAMAGQLAGQLQHPDGTVHGTARWCANGRGLLMMFPVPLAGRPQVRAVRFSSVAPDATAAWHKTAVDVLRTPRTRAGRLVPGLGVIDDDRPAMLELREWWEPAPKGEGFALIEVWTGEKQ
jgi:hypothetical protein